MVKAFISSLILLIILTSTYAQTPIGLKYDCDGYAFNNYFDPLTYSPTKKLTKVHNSDSYEIGYYFDKSGKKVSGLIKFQDKKIWFKVGKKEYRNKIKPEDIKEFVIGVDSFFTISKYYYKNSLKTKPVFVQFISTFNNYTFAKHYHFKSMVIQGQSPIVETYLVKSNGSDTWENFPDNNKFKEKALKYFNHIPYLKTKISSGEYKSKDMLSIIKMAEYYDKHKSSKAILYDKYWQETRDVKKAEYTAKITDIQDTTWTLEYYRNSTKLYQANYTSFFPNTKNGDFIAYYSNGETRQIISYDNNMPKEVKFYNESGQLKKHYQYLENKKESDSKTDLNYKYITVNDSIGKNILTRNAKLVSFDEYSNTNYTAEYRNKKINASYRLLGKDTIFQITNSDYDFNIKALQKKFSQFFYDKTYNKALNVNAQGTLLVYLIIDDKGCVIKSDVLNSIHQEIDSLVNQFIKRTLLNGAKYKFKPYKRNKAKRYFELVMPIEFSINRFYRKPVNYNHFNHWQMHHMMHQQAMHQHMMQLNRPPMSGSF